jgi:hypothetical protein
MLNIPPEILNRFVAALGEKRVPCAQQTHFRKWLRYYLDFCHKYRLEAASSNSLAQFQEKLREKRQTDFQIRQAAQAVAPFFELQGTLKSSSTAPRAKPFPIAAEASSPYGPAVPLPTGKAAGTVPKTQKSPVERTSWERALSDLVGIIKTKHYSPKTLKSYNHWAQKFREFKCKEKGSSLLLTHHPEEVSAPSASTARAGQA